MKKMKRIIAATLALTVLFTTSVMAQTPREILSQAYAQSAEATTSSITGFVEGTVFMMGVELLQMHIGIHMDMDIDLDAGTMTMYMRMPMVISGTDPLTGQSMDESTEVAVFMDETRMLVYEASLGGWFTDPSMDMADMGDMFALLGDMEEMTAWFMEINEQIMDEITIQFAADQVEGFYVIEQFMDWDDVLNMLDMFLTPDFFDAMFAFMPEEDLAELDMVMAELDGVMDELLALLDDIEIDLQMVYRSYIDVETLEFQNYLMTMDLTFAVEMGIFDITGDFTMFLDINYNPTIVWPVIDNVLTLDDIMAAMFEDVVETEAEELAEAVATIETFDLVLAEENLEERFEGLLGGMTTAVIELDVADIASFNIFIVNHGTEAVSVTLAGAVNEMVQPGQSFVVQLPAGAASGDLVVEGGGAPITVETGFRLTNYPLNR